MKNISYIILIILSLCGFTDSNNIISAVSLSFLLFCIARFYKEREFLCFVSGMLIAICYAIYSKYSVGGTVINFLLFVAANNYVHRGKSINSNMLLTLPSVVFYVTLQLATVFLQGKIIALTALIGIASYAVFVIYGNRKK